MQSTLQLDAALDSTVSNVFGPGGDGPPNCRRNCRRNCCRNFKFYSPARKCWIPGTARESNTYTYILYTHTHTHTHPVFGGRGAVHAAFQGPASCQKPRAL